MANRLKSIGKQTITVHGIRPDGTEVKALQTEDEVYQEAENVFCTVSDGARWPVTRNHDGTFHSTVTVVRKSTSPSQVPGDPHGAGDPQRPGGAGQRQE